MIHHPVFSSSPDANCRRNLRRAAAALAVIFAAIVCLAAYSLAKPAANEPFNGELFDGMRWRLIGPFRGGRALTAAGVPGHPNQFYFGAVAGGVWWSADAGRVWKPIFDAEPIASIGALAVAPSDAGVIYVGSGEADMRSDISYGDGMYKSTDAGATWQHIGLEDTRQIGRVLVDPRDPNVVFVAALGHAYGPNAERGVFRSTDGGQSWKKILYKDENTGAIDLAFDSTNPNIIYAALWQTRRPPWNVYPPSNGPGSGLYKSSDGGESWNQLTNGLPTEGLGRMGIAVSPADPSRVYLIVDAKQGGLYRSDDAGASWRLTDNEHRIWGRGWYFGGVTADTKDRDTVYVANTSLYRSQDGGASFTAIKGAPGGDDYHRLWIDPNDPERMILASDQGVVISLDGARTWSSWYNQPTGQFYHGIADNRFPFSIYGAQQDSGAAGTTTRSYHRGIATWDWEPMDAGGENGYVAPDPLNPNMVYGGTVTREDQTTRQNQSIPPMLAHPGSYRHTWTLPLVFSPTDPHKLYFGSQVLFRTANGGQTWDVISPDLTREDPGVPSNLDASTAADGAGGPRRGVIYTIAPSPVRAGLIWIGTDDGLIQRTDDDGAKWSNVTPNEITAWSKVTMIEASHFDANTAYAAVDRHRLEDLHAYLYRTRDGGKTWQRADSGIPEGCYLNAIREDTRRKGLLFAGTEKGAFVSFDDGEDWQSLRLNLPVTSIRDFTIRDNDLLAATHGRAFWVLDDITPLRQLNSEIAQSSAWLFQTETATRVRPGSDEGTPLPPEEPAGENPPNGAIIDYYLGPDSTAAVKIDILDSSGKVVRRFSSEDAAAVVDPKMLDIPAFWIHPAAPPSALPGMHRFLWDLHYPGAEAGGGNSYFRFFGFGLGPWAMPGQYTVRLTAGDKSFTRTLTVKMDPRIKAPLADLEKQFDMARQITTALDQIAAAEKEVKDIRGQIDKLRSGSTLSDSAQSGIASFESKMAAVAGPAGEGGGLEEFGFGEPATGRDSLAFLAAALRGLDRTIESADTAPTTDAGTAFNRDQQTLHATLGKWEHLRTADLNQLNQTLRQDHLPPITLEGQSKVTE